MSARNGREGSDRAPAGPTGPAGADSSPEDEFEIIEVVGVNETDPPAVVAHGEGREVPPEEPAGPPPSEDLQEALREKEHYHDLWLRQQAEFDNFRKRTALNAERQRTGVAADLVRCLLPVLDNLERALRHSTREDPLRSGVALIRQQMLEVLGKEGLAPIEAVGARFDPHHHEAVEVRDADGCEEGIVLEEVQKGFTFKDMLIRPALVKVSSGRGGATGAQSAAD
jgi:molecular chaperone GrpE